MQVLFDTNVLVSAVLFGGLPRRLLDEALQSRFVLVTGVELLDVPAVSIDPDDDVVLATADAGAVEFVVTGDKDLLVLGTPCDVAILTPRQFAQRLAPS